MNRLDFHKAFRSVGPAVLPVIHVLDDRQAERNAALAIECGAHGIFLINHDFAVEPFLPIIRHLRSSYPSLWLGVNFLGVPLADAMPTIADLQRDGVAIDGYWADDARIDESQPTDRQPEASRASAQRSAAHWPGLYFGGTAFKKQRAVAQADYPRAAAIASQWMDVVTTSGTATGNAAELDKIAVFREVCGDTALAVASGITPENAGRYAPMVDAFLVATGINRSDDFYNIDAEKLRALVQICREYGATHG
jgi:2-keto-3-deoxy-6-phosphogluconate aldolase